jgi:hypothetical protein
MPRKGERAAKRDARNGRKKWSDKERRDRRELGQNFLKDRRIARWIVAKSGVEEGDLVVEGRSPTSSRGWHGGWWP